LKRFIQKFPLANYIYLNRTYYRPPTVKLLQFSSAYLLVSHGSRDPRPQVAVEQLAELLKLRLEGVIGVLTPPKPRHLAMSLLVETPNSVLHKPLVGMATLELAPLPLHEQIRQFGDRAKAVGCKHLLVLPLFLLPGVHVMEDIPAEVALAQKAIGSDLIIDLQPHLGTHPDLWRLLAQTVDVGNQAKILLSHGSRRRGANQSVEAIATQLGAVSAYWSVSPSLESRVEELVNAGNRQIAILPYFLFAGGITDAIAQAVEQLQERFPNVQLSLSEPIGTSPELADLILDFTTN
jgi:sirohydrochlorin cobaltochelatase